GGEGVPLNGSHEVSVQGGISSGAPKP
ncbi:MAG: hypothetical protein QOE89_316, partial [Pseudonocardiales bacterium]|nr:hypothetical protein [Pseudonocardiales bacterium]